MTQLSRTLLLLLCSLGAASAMPGTPNKCDVNQDGATTVVDVQAFVNVALGVNSGANDLNGDGAITVVDVQIDINAALALGCSIGSPGTNLFISDFNPKTGAAGTSITITGTNFGTSPQVTMPAQGGGTILQPISSAASGSITFVLAAGTATGAVTVSNGSSAGATAASFTVTPSSTFSIAASPSTASLIQGQSVSYAVTLSSANGFSQLASLSVTGAPSGVSASITPASVTAGQTAVVHLTALSGQPTGTSNLTVTAAATVEGIAVTQTAPVSLSVVAPSTSFTGRTVVSDSVETPLAGVTVTTLGLDGGGKSTGCTGHSVISDAAGNFALTNLPAACVGPQLIGFNGNTVTSPAGTYAGVNLVFTLISGQVVVSPVLVHMPRIDNSETFMVQQNAGADQSYVFQSIPGLSVTVYAGTTLTLADGTKPNPFPLTAIQVPVDRLPDQMPLTNSMVTAFIVAFQPANTVASKAVAVWFPNTLNTPPGTNEPLMTLDPTLGRMVAYGTGTVSNDGTTIIPDVDPASGSLNHRFGIVHFDWHGPAAALASLFKLICGCLFESPKAGGPVDLSSGVNVITSTDMVLNGNRGPVTIERTYRTLSAQLRAFGIGSSFNYDYRLDTQTPQSDAVVNVEYPNGTLIPFARQADGTLVNRTVPLVAGAVLTTAPNGTATLRFKNGSYFGFSPGFALAKSVLTSVGDPNGNITKIVRSSNDPRVITEIDDPVGRKLTFTWNGAPTITSITDPIGRVARYTYNADDTLATFTNVLGGITKYTYDAQQRLLTVTDPRGVITESNTYDANGRVASQLNAAGGKLKFISGAGDPLPFGYLLTNALVPTSPVSQATYQDPRGNPTVYRFNPQGYVVSATDATGQTRNINRAPGTNFIISMTGAGTCPVCGDPRIGDVSFTYDANGNMLTRTDALGHTTSFAWEPTFSRLTSVTDALGNQYKLIYDGSGNLTKFTDPRGNSVSLSRDGNGLITAIKDAVGNVTNLTYDTLVGDLSAATNPLSQTTLFNHDAASRLSALQDPLSQTSTGVLNAGDEEANVTEGNGRNTQFGYDTAGFLTSYTDPNGNQTRLTYDTAGRLSSIKDPLNRSSTYQYDVSNNVVNFTNRRGQTATYTYDSLNRLLSETYVDATVHRSYDAAGHLIQVVDSQAGTFSLAYDAVGRLSKMAGPNGTISYTRDVVGRVTTRQVQGQPAVNYTYDANGNLTIASMNSASVTRTYDPRDLLTSTTRSNGVIGSYGYDSMGRLVTMSEQANGSTIFSRGFTYGAASDLTGSSLDQGKPLATPGATGTFDAANQLMLFGGTTFTNDSDGHRLSETSSAGTTSYTWDARGRLQRIVAPGGVTTTFLYDWAGNMIEKQVASGGQNSKQDYVLDDAANVVSIQEGGTVTSILDGRAPDDVIAIVQAGAATFPLADQISSESAFTDGSGNVVGREFYEAFGASSSAGTVSLFQFTGRLQVNSGLYYYRARFYDSNTGRFLSEDPIGLIGGDANFYRYVGNDPVSFNDPEGLVSLSDIAKIAPRSWFNIGKAFGKKVGKDEIKDHLEDWGVDKAADFVSCVTGKEWAGDIVKTAADAFSLGEHVFAIGSLGALALATTGPVVLVGTLLFLGYESFGAGGDAAKVFMDFGHLYNHYWGSSTGQE